MDREANDYCLLSYTCSRTAACIRNAWKGNLFQNDPNYLLGTVDSVNSLLLLICSRIFLLLWNPKLHYSHYKSLTTEPIIRHCSSVLHSIILTPLEYWPSIYGICISF